MGVSYGGSAPLANALVGTLHFNRGADLPLHRDLTMASARLKVSKAEALYQGHPHGFKWCRKCTMFRNPDKCTKVAGEIRNIGYCRFYVAKGARDD